MRRAVVALCLGLAACGGTAGPPPVPGAPRDLPAVAFGPPRPVPAQRPNAQIAQDYRELVFRMESGRAVPVLSRFEGPIRVAMTGPVPAAARADLRRLLARLRAEAGLDIAEGPPESAQIRVEFLPRSRLRAAVPQAACFVAPRVGSFAEYRAARGGARLDWTTLTRREAATLFIPSDTSPQEIRDCLHEELAQALGPLNDLFRLPDSVFNDDNFQSVLTGFDMLILRVHYAPELANGMTEAEVAARLPAILDRLNPAGRGGSAWGAPETPPAFVEAINSALGGTRGLQDRISAAERAVAIAEDRGWRDSRAGFAWFALGRLLLARSPERALEAFLRASALFHASPLTRVQAAHADVQLAAFALGAGQYSDALALATAAAPVALQAENAALLSTALAIRAEALAAAGQRAEADAVRLDSLVWGRYGFGPAAQARAAEIAGLAAR